MAAPYEDEDQTVSENALSPGPLRMSELDPTPSEVHALPRPPRKLEPISPVKKRRRKKGSTARKERASDDTQHTQHPTEPPSAIESSLIHQLRARLDPIYNPPVSSLADAPLQQLPSPESHQGGSESHRGGEGAHQTHEHFQRRSSHNLEPDSLESTSKEVLIGGREGDGRRQKRTRKRRKRDRDSKRAVDDEGVSRGEPEGEAESQLEEGRGVATPQEQGTPQALPGRQLPVDPEGVWDASGPTVAEELEANRLYPNIHPDDPQLMVSEEDITEERPEDVGLHYTLPSLQGQVLSRQTKDVVYVERRDGRGFVARRKDEESGEKEERGLGRGTSGWEVEISSADYAVYAHKVTQRIAFTAHGLVAGISLWDCIVSNVLSQQPGRHVDLLTFYHPLTLPVHAVYLLLLSTVMLSLMDRFDFAHFDKNCLQTLIKSPSQILLLIASFLVVVALTLTLSVAAIDERIALYPNQPTLWMDVLVAVNTSLPSPQDPTALPATHTDGSLVYVAGDSPVSSLVLPWLALSIVRALCCCVSWMVVVWITAYDRLLDYLQDSVTSCTDVHHLSKTDGHSV